jgi:uncharacterized lipoprotein YmbA
MKNLIIIIAALLMISCSVEQRIKDYSYTEEWYFKENIRYQVYKTKQGKRYIIIINKRNTNLKRQYIK